MENAKSEVKGRWKIQTLTLPNKIKLRYGLYCQNENAIEHYVLFLNGHGEFIEKYDYLPEDLKLPSNYAFLTWDHRGQGASDGEPRLHVEDYDQLGKDAQHIVKTLVANKPYTVIAHSMGGLVALYSTMKSYLEPQKLILSAPLFGVQHFIPDSIGRAVGNFLTRLGFGKTYFQRQLQTNMKFKNNMFTHSEERFERRYKSPYEIEGITFGWIKASFDAIDYVTDEANLARFKTPTKVLFGDDERLVSTKAIRKWIKKAKKLSKAKVCFEELAETRHEIFAEAPPSYNRVLDLTRKCMLGT